MSTYPTYPRVESVEALANHHLLVTFRNNAKRLYDFKPRLEEEPFQLLRNEAFFRSVKADPHGYGIVWNDDLDLAESELWLNGKPVEAPELAAR